MPWVETETPSFVARHEADDEDDVVALLELLEGTREELAAAFHSLPDEVTVVVHGSDTALALAQPALPLARRLTAPAARRYLTGWASRREIHVLAPRLLRARASNVEGSREMALLAPAALLVHIVVGHNNPALPPPYTPRALARYVRWAWLVHGVAQWLSGQTQHARPAIARRLREGSRPAFPPGLRDAPLLGGTVVDLVARQSGPRSVVGLATDPLPRSPRDALLHAFGGRPVAESERSWRAHLEDVAGAAGGA